MSDGLSPCRLAYAQSTTFSTRLCAPCELLYRSSSSRPGGVKTSLISSIGLSPALATLSAPAPCCRVFSIQKCRRLTISRHPGHQCEGCLWQAGDPPSPLPRIMASIYSYYSGPNNNLTRAARRPSRLITLVGCVCSRLVVFSSAEVCRLLLFVTSRFICSISVVQWLPN